MKGKHEIVLLPICREVIHLRNREWGRYLNPMPGGLDKQVLLMSRLLCLSNYSFSENITQVSRGSDCAASAQVDGGEQAYKGKAKLRPVYDKGTSTSTCIHLAM